MYSDDETPNTTPRSLQTQSSPNTSMSGRQSTPSTTPASEEYCYEVQASLNSTFISNVSVELPGTYPTNEGIAVVARLAEDAEVAEAATILTAGEEHQSTHGTDR